VTRQDFSRRSQASELTDTNPVSFEEFDDYYGGKRRQPAHLAKNRFMARAALLTCRFVVRVLGTTAAALIIIAIAFSAIPLYICREKASCTVPILQWSGRSTAGLPTTRSFLGNNCASEGRLFPNHPN
jgi:hypothetical protein